MMTQTIQLCEICREGITDPVCLRCYNKQLLIWLKENIGNRELIRYIMKSAVRDVLSDNLNEDYCILCNKEAIFICRHCYFSAIKRALQEMNMPNNLVNNFSKLFNYEPIFQIY